MYEFYNLKKNCCNIFEFYIYLVPPNKCETFMILLFLVYSLYFVLSYNFGSSIFMILDLDTCIIHTKCTVKIIIYDLLVLQ